MDPSVKLTTAALSGARVDAHKSSSPVSLIRIPPLYAALSFLLAAALISGFIWHDLRAAYRDTLNYWNVQLSNSADDRARVATLWRSERRTDTEAVAENPFTVRLLSPAQDRSKVRETRRGVEQTIERIARVNGFLGGAVGDSHCRIVAEFGIRPEMAQHIREACQRIQREGGFRLDSSGMDQARLWLNFAAPVFADGEGSPRGQVSCRTVGAVVMVAEPWKGISPVNAAESDPTRTSDSLFVWKQDNEAFIFSPRLRAERAEALFRLPLNGPALESRVARGGNVAFGEFTDYQGMRVFAAARQIALGGDSLVRKVDRNVALSEYRRRSALEWLAAGLSVLLFALVMVLQQRQAATAALKEKLRQQQALLELRRHAEASEERFSKAFQASPMVLTITSLKDDRYIEVNNAFEQITGWRRDEVLGRTFAELNLWVKPQARERAFQTLNAEKRLRNLEGLFRTKTGELRVALVSAEIIEFEGEPCVLAVVEDITERKRAEKELQRSFEHLRALAARLQVVREEERKTVAREIHDELGQALTAIKIDLASLIRELPADQKQHSKRTDSILALVDGTIQSVRRISTELRPGILDDLGLVAAVEWAAEEFEARTGIRCEIDLPEEDIVIDPDHATAIFRIFQETLTNVARHANASRVDVRLAKENGDLSLEVHDNGTGIGEEQAATGRSLGILGMKERALLLGGKLTICGATGKGTTVGVRIPAGHRA